MKTEQYSVYRPETKQTVIDRITKKDEGAFRDFLASQADRPTLNLSPEAARIFIPPRILELADNPEKTKLRVLEKRKDKFSFFIVEEKPEAHTGSDAYMNDLLKAKEKDGILQQNDFIYNFATLYVNKNYSGDDVLSINNYVDNPDMRRKGMGTSFYKKLRHTAKDLGFRHIRGTGYTSNLSFFTEKLGRQRLADLPPHMKEKFYKDSWMHISRQIMKNTTIDLLYPEDLKP